MWSGAPRLIYSLADVPSQPIVDHYNYYIIRWFATCGEDECWAAPNFLQDFDEVANAKLTHYARVHVDRPFPYD